MGKYGEVWKYRVMMDKYGEVRHYQVQILEWVIMVAMLAQDTTTSLTISTMTSPINSHSSSTLNGLHKKWSG